MFDWKPEYSLNIAEIDAQHKKLFELAGRLYDIAKLKDEFDNNDKILAVFKELSDYTVYHFGYEEKLFDHHGFNAIQSKLHKLEHVIFIDKMIKVQEEGLNKNQREVIMDIIVFAADWIEKHILYTDKKYAEVLYAKGVR